MGARHTGTRNLDRPGISSVFPYRVALRIQEMLRAMKRSGLPGVVRTDAVKTKGATLWCGAGDFRRLIGTEDEASYLRHLYHSVRTLLESSKAPRDMRKAAEEAATLGLLTQFVPKLTPGHVDALEAENTRISEECRRLGKTQGTAARVARMASQVASSSASLPPPAPFADVGDNDDTPQTRPKPPPPSDTYVSSSASSLLGLASDDGADPNADDEADSRKVSTDDSWDGQSEASTDPFGFSPDIAPAGEDDEPASPSVACTDGASQASP